MSNFTKTVIQKQKKHPPKNEFTDSGEPVSLSKEYFTLFKSEMAQMIACIK